MTQTMIAVLVPTALAIVAAAISIFRRPGERLTSGIQHFAAGLVIAAVMVELVPEMTKGHPSIMVPGFAAGVALMLGVKLFAQSKADRDDGSAVVATAGFTLLITVAIDLWVDGFLLGMTLGSETIHSLSLIVALAMEVAFLALATTTALLSNGETSQSAFAKTFGVILPFPIGALIGYLISGALSGAALIFAISFAAAALLYLVVEELLVEAHAGGDTPWGTALFFVGFLIVLLIE